jgi:hypothetical protein
MFQIDNSTAAVSEPTRGAVGPKPNAFFTDATTGGTVVTADFMNACMKELANFVTQSGATLSKSDDTQLYTALLSYLKGTSTNIVNPFMNYALFRDEKTSGTGGGNSVVGWNTRDIQQIVNNISGASITTNQITLPAGKYRVSGLTPGYNSSGTSHSHQSGLYNATDASFTLGGGISVIGSNATMRDSNSCPSHFAGEFTLAASKVIELQDYWTAAITNGFGIPISSGQGERYSQIEIWKLD